MGQPPLPAPVVPETMPAEQSIPAEPSLGDLLRVVILETLADTYVDDKHWGRQEERFSGISVRGLNVRVREKLVNHGFWQRYSATLLQPEENLKVEIRPVDQPVEERTAFDVIVFVRARTEATFALWTYGVKGLNGTVKSDANLQVNIRLLVTPQTQLNWDKLVPDIGLDIKVANVDVEVRDLDLRRIGFIGGWAARQIGDGSREAIRTLVDLQEPRIEKKLQSRLDRLRLQAD